MAFLQQILESGMMENMQPATGPYHERRPGGLYHTMVEKLAPFAMRGVIWYQGESDGDSHAKEYETVFSLLIQNWRELWNEEFPFLYVQLAPLREWMTAGGAYHIVCAAQDRIKQSGRLPLRRYANWDPDGCTPRSALAVARRKRQPALPVHGKLRMSYSARRL